MLMLGNLFELAERRLIEKGKPYTGMNVLDDAIKIRKWLDKHQNTVSLRAINKQAWYREKYRRYYQKKENI
mgnify:CR=1 FL=1